MRRLFNATVTTCTLLALQACATGSSGRESVTSSEVTAVDRTPSTSDAQAAVAITTASQDGLTIPDPVTCAAPGSTSRFSIANLSSRTIGFTSKALLFDDYPSRETGRNVSLVEGYESVSNSQPPGLVEWPLIALTDIEPGSSMSLLLVSPPDPGLWTLVVRTEPIGQETDGTGDRELELVMPFAVSAQC